MIAFDASGCVANVPTTARTSLAVTTLCPEYAFAWSRIFIAPYPGSSAIMSTPPSPLAGVSWTLYPARMYDSAINSSKRLG